MKFLTTYIHDVYHQSVVLKLLAILFHWAGFPQATNVARRDFFFRLVSSRLELIKNLFNFGNIKSRRATFVAKWKTTLTDIFLFCF